VAAEPSSQTRLGAVLFYGVVLLLAYLVYLVFEPFLIPLAWAAVIVVVFYPWHLRLERRWGRTQAAAGSIVGVTVVLIIPTLLVMSAFVREGVEAARSSEQAFTTGHLAWANHAWEWIAHHVPGETPESLASLARQGAESLGAFLASQLGAALRNIVRFFFDLFVMLLAMFYLFRDAPSVMAAVRHALPFEEVHREKMIAEARELIYASVTSSLIAALASGLVGGAAFAIARISAPVFWGVATAFASFIPLVGSALVWVTAGIWLIAQGHTGRGIFVLAFCAAVLGIVDNVLRPWLISGKAQLSGLLVFIGVVGGITVFGLLGVVLGPIVVAAAASVLDIYTPRGHPQHSETAKPNPVGEKRTAVLE
jgi:predicted PurR-regulated permease PerM